LWRTLKTSCLLYDDYDISIAPILPTTFNSCKSNLKVVEAAAKGKAIVCDKHPPYLDHQEGVIYVDDWVKELPEIMQDYDYVKMMADRLRKTVLENYNIKEITKKRMKLYESL